MNVNIIIIALILIIPFYYLIKKIVQSVKARRNREKVSILLEDEVEKKVETGICRYLKNFSDIITPKYLANIFYKQYPLISKYSRFIPITSMVYINSDEMEANYYFNMLKNNIAKNLLFMHKVPEKYYGNFIFPGFQDYITNIQSIQLNIFGNAIKFPATFHFNDCIIYPLKGTIFVHTTFPNMAKEMDPYECFPFFRKNILDEKTHEIREGDYIYIPNGFIFEIEVKIGGNFQGFAVIQFSKTNELKIMKIEQMQMRKIDKLIYPKKLDKIEFALLWKLGKVNGDTWEKNKVIKNSSNFSTK